MLVRTFTGAWIETNIADSTTKLYRFAPSRVRGLKPQAALHHYYRYVRTFTGAWIETLISILSIYYQAVRTFTGAWIET